MRLWPKQDETIPRATPALKLPFEWKQGQHLSLTGDTGSGKTTLASLLLYARSHTLSFRSKADDAILPGRLIRTADEFERADWDANPRFLLDPLYARQFYDFYRAMDIAWKAGRWTLYLDELWYLNQLKGPGTSNRTLRLGDKIDEFLTQGRSKKLTVISGMQRPVQVTRFAMSQATHNIAFSADGRDIKTLAEIGTSAWAKTVSELGRYEFAWFHRPSREVWRGRVQDLLAPQA